MKAKITTAALFACSAICIVWLVVRIRPGGPYQRVVVAASLVFLVASVGIFVRPRLAYFMGLVSGTVALHWFSQIEFWDFPVLNSWICFNLADGEPSIVTAELKILFVITLVISTACSFTRLLPVKWKIRTTSVQGRTWPAFFVCFLVIAFWYGVSVKPYRIPYIVDAVMPELVVLHVEKNGVQFHETAVTAHRDRRFYFSQNDRRLFQYRFSVRYGEGMIPEDLTRRVQMLAQPPQFVNLRTPPAVALRQWNAEGWFVRTPRGILAFTTENGAAPPKEVVDVFHELESVARVSENRGMLKDVCMGFCYDPPAGLGLMYMNQR